MFANIFSIFPSFHVLTDESKFLYLFQCEEYDIVEVIVMGVNEMYNRRNELIDKYFSKISGKDIFGYCLKNDGNSLHNVTVS
jgi:hypothetical protein